MSERESEQTEKEARRQKKSELLALAKEMIEVQEGFPFPGIRAEVYSAIKAADEEYPIGRSAHIDELLKQFQEQGMKIALSVNHPESGNVYVMPLNCTDQEDSLSPKQLVIVEGMDDKLAKLILAHIELEKLETS
jgi:hypothetical protein